MSGRILVVDDEAGVRAIVRETLRRAGFQVATVGNGADALALLAGGEPFDALLLDLSMPEMNGAEVLRRLEHDRVQLPVVLTSGYSAQEALARVERDRLAGFIQKPFMPADLVVAMHDAVAGRGRFQ